jgi:hypothetical protein
MGIFRMQSVLPKIEQVYIEAARYPINAWIVKNQVPSDLGFLPTWNKEQSIKASDLSKYEIEFFFGVMTGRVNLDNEWDAYVRRWLSIGGQELQDEATKVFKTRGW